MMPGSTSGDTCGHYAHVMNAENNNYLVGVAVDVRGLVAVSYTHLTLPTILRV